MSERKLGPNMKRLLAVKVSRDAIPSGGGFADGLSLFLEPGKLAAVSRNALAWIDEAISAVKAAPDNPYGDNEETIAAAILEKLDIREPGDDGLLTCSVCRDRYTTNPSGVCDNCKHEQWLDTHA